MFELLLSRCPNHREVCTKLLRRSVKHLFPIEVRVEDSTNDSSTEKTQEQPCNLASAQQPNDNSTQMTELDVTAPDKRPCRQAAIAGEQHRKNN